MALPPRCSCRSIVQALVAVACGALAYAPAARGTADDAAADVAQAAAATAAAAKQRAPLLLFRRDDAPPPATAPQTLPDDSAVAAHVPSSDASASGPPIEAPAAGPPAEAVSPTDAWAAEDAADDAALAAGATRGSAAGARLAPSDPRRLAPPKNDRRSATRDRPRATLAERFAIPWNRNALASTLLAVGLAAGLLWALSGWLGRSSPAGRGVLPPEALTVLGRSTLADQTPIHLLRIGARLVLVAGSGEHLRTLTEIDDPHEVERLAGICQQSHRQGPAAEFQQVLEQLSREPARGFLGGEARRR